MWTLHSSHASRREIYIFREKLEQNLHFHTSSAHLESRRIWPHCMALSLRRSLVKHTYMVILSESNNNKMEYKEKSMSENNIYRCTKLTRISVTDKTCITSSITTYYDNYALFRYNWENLAWFRGPWVDGVNELMQTPSHLDSFSKQATPLFYTMMDNEMGK